MVDRMYLNDMRFQANVGVTEAERFAKQTISVTVGLEADLKNAGAADELRRTINYADLYKEIHALVEGREFNLIEAVAEAVTDVVLKHPRVDAVLVRVVKQLPKPRYNLRDVTVEIYRKRGE